MELTNGDQRIDEYIGKLPTWQKDICEHIRKLMHIAEPEIVETIKRKNQPYFTFKGNVSALLGTRDHVNIFIYDPIAPDTGHIINQGQDNLTARSIQIYQGDKINEHAFINLIKAVIENNKAGGWRRLKKPIFSKQSGK
jgi:hypothetical protein